MKSILRERHAAFVLLLAVACGGGKKDTDKPSLGGGEGGADEGQAAEAQRLPEIPATPAPLPNSVLGTLSIGNPTGQLANLAAFADAVQPGFGAMVAPAQLLQGMAGTVGAPGLEGADLNKPLHLLLLDPKKGGGPALLVVAVADQQKMIGTVGGGAVAQFHGGYAAIGAGAAILAASPYALSNLAKTQPPAHPHAVIYVNRIMDSYGAEIDSQFRQSMGGSPAEAEKKMAEGMIQVMQSIERIEADLDASAQGANATFAVFPEQGSGLAAWAGLQKPSDYTVASRLPAGQWLLVGAGRIDSSSLQGFATDMATAQGKPEIAEWAKVFGHEVAVAVLAKEDKTLRAAGIVALTDAKKLGQLATDYVKKMAAQPTAMDSMQVTAKAGAYKTGGASLHAVTVKPGPQASEEDKKEFDKVFGKAGMKSYFGVAGDWMVFTLDKDASAKSMAAKLVQNSKSKQPKLALGPSFEKALADSKTRNESGILVIDLAAVAPDPTKAQGAEVTIGLGFDGPVMRSRFSFTPATIQFFMQQQMRGRAP